MGFLDSVKGSATKAKLRGEIALLDREIHSLQSAFGVELYDKLTMQQQQQSSSKPGGGFVPSGIVPNIHLDDLLPSSANQKALKEPLEACRRDVVAKEDEIAAKRREIEKLQCDRERSRIKSAFEKMKSDAAGRSAEAKLHVEIKLREREIRQRKEQFGRDVYDALAESNDNSERSGGGSAGGGGGIMNKLKPEKNRQQNREIAGIIARAERPVSLARQKKAAAERGVAEIDAAAAAAVPS